MLGAPLLFQVSCPSWAGGCCLPSLASKKPRLGVPGRPQSWQGSVAELPAPPGLAAHQLALGLSWLLPGPVWK